MIILNIKNIGIIEINKYIEVIKGIVFINNEFVLKY